MCSLSELFAVIGKGPGKPLVICSIRTLPQEETPDIDDDAASVNAYLKRNYSCVFHHVDPRTIPLDSLGPHMREALSGIPVWQTGFVRRPFAPGNGAVVSNGLLLTIGGGSAAGARMMERWISAAKNGSDDLFPLVAVCGPLMDSESRRAMHAHASPYITVYDWVSNMDELIRSSRAVVCLGGYNTLVEALSQNKPVLSFPYAGLGDQLFQVNALHAHGVLLKGDTSQSDRDTTSQMNELLSFRPKYQIDSNGAERSVKIAEQALRS
jgi:predicted glycosyltransferase